MQQRDLLKSWTYKAESALKHGENKDIVAAHCCSELQIHSEMAENWTSPPDILKPLCRNKPAVGVPNVFITLWTLLTPYLYTASSEQKLSKPELINTNLWTMTTQDSVKRIWNCWNLDLKQLVSAPSMARVRTLF